MSIGARILALVVVVALLTGVAVPAALAGGSTTANVALGLASFAVFNQLVGGWWYPRPAYAWYGPRVYYPGPAYYYPGPAYYPAPVYYYAPPPAVTPPPTPAPPQVVHYPHGRYELRGDGVTTAYQWVWIPNPPAPPAAPSAPGQPR
jgi:hypothetical protein